MKQYEYKVIYWNVGDNDDWLLNRAGAEGWELTGVASRGDMVTFYLMRSRTSRPIVKVNINGKDVEF